MDPWGTPILISPLFYLAPLYSTYIGNEESYFHLIQQIHEIYKQVNK